jgi:hypothetical protein
MVEANSNTIWEELKRATRETKDPRGAGLLSRKTLMGSDAESFSDLMLKEWATEMSSVNKDDDKDTLGDCDTPCVKCNTRRSSGCWKFCQRIVA